MQTIVFTPLICVSVVFVQGRLHEFSRRSWAVWISSRSLSASALPPKPCSMISLVLHDAVKDGGQVQGLQ